MCILNEQIQRMAYIDYYKTLGIDKSATEEDIRKAYRKLARKYHPDLNPNDDSAKQKFQEINEANEVLKDPEKRKKYDKYGENWKHGDAYEQAQRQSSASGNPFGQGGRSYQYTGNFDESQFSDFFEEMFGSRFGGGRQTKFRGQDLQATLSLTLEEAAQTHQKTFTIHRKNIRITIPAGVRQGQKIKLSGHGAEGVNGGPKGDLYITFDIQNHPIFTRQGDDLSTEVSIDLFTALLGGDVLIQTLDGKIKAKIQAGTQPGSRIRIPNKGFPVYKKKDTFGDLYAQIKVDVPTQLSDKEKELVEEWAKIRGK